MSVERCATHRPSNRTPVCQPPCSGQNGSRTRSLIGGAPSMGNGPRANTDGGGSFIMRLLDSTPAPPHKVTVFLTARKSRRHERSTSLLMATVGRERFIPAQGRLLHITSISQKPCPAHAARAVAFGKLLSTTVIGTLQ